MLNDKDIEFIKKNREQIREHRTEPFVIYAQVESGRDPFTDDVTYTEEEETVQGVDHVLYSMSGGEGEVAYLNGVEIETDDVIVEFDLSVDLSNVKQIKRVRDGKRYVIKAKDKLGLGEPNRHFVLLELTK